jgi:hypothetical protein
MESWALNGKPISNTDNIEKNFFILFLSELMETQVSGSMEKASKPILGITKSKPLSDTRQMTTHRLC